MSKKFENDDNNNEEHYKKYNGLWGDTLSQLKNRLVYSPRIEQKYLIGGIKEASCESGMYTYNKAFIK